MVNETNTAHQLRWEGSTVRARGPPLLTLKTPPLMPAHTLFRPLNPGLPTQVPNSQP